MKVLKHKNIYLLHGLFKTWYSKICDFSEHVNEIVEYFKQPPPFGKGQGLSKDEFIDLFEFALI